MIFMSFLSDGLIQGFLDILGVQVNTPSSQHVVFVASAAFVTIALISLMQLLFKFLVYLRKG